jgi:sugar-specific transcriptional regulator TrmB
LEGLNKLSKKRIIEALKGLGLTQVDTQIYIFLTKEGPHRIEKIALVLNLPEEKIDRSLKDLQSINIVKVSIEYPLEFVAMPFEEVIDLFIEVKKEQAKTMEKTEKNSSPTGKKQ